MRANGVCAVCVYSFGTPAASEIAGGGCPTHMDRATDHEGIRVLIFRSIHRFLSLIVSLRRVLFVFFLALLAFLIVLLIKMFS